MQRHDFIAASARFSCTKFAATCGEAFRAASTGARREREMNPTPECFANVVRRGYDPVMSDPQPTREQFTDQVAEIVRGKFPLVKIGSVEGVFALKLNGHTASLENLYRITLLRPEEVQRTPRKHVDESPPSQPGEMCRSQSQDNRRYRPIADAFGFG